MAQLYGARWQVELDIRALKVNLGLGESRCQSPDMLAKEIWGGLLAYNLVRKVGCQAASLQGVRPRQISFTACRQALCAGLKQRVLATTEQQRRQGAALLERLGQEQVGNRPGRVEPRAVKRSGKGYPRLRQPRAKAGSVAEGERGVRWGEPEGTPEQEDSNGTDPSRAAGRRVLQPAAQPVCTEQAGQPTDRARTTAWPRERQTRGNK